VARGHMTKVLLAVAAMAVALTVMGIGAGVALYHLYPHEVVRYTSLARNYIRSWTAPAGTVTTELNPAYHAPATAAPRLAAAAPELVAAAAPAGEAERKDWPSYNRTLTSERYSPLDEINPATVEKLKIVCSYDTRQYSNFESGLIMAHGALIGTTEFDIFSLDPATCAENWRTHENLPPSYYATNRGASYLNGMLFRGFEDGRVRAYDFKTGKRIWETAIADPSLGESAPAAPIAWDGLVFIGNASGDARGGKGRVYALDAKTGKVVWEFYLVPRVEGDRVRGPQGASPLDKSTWANAAGIPISGGGSWTSLTLDPETGELFVPVGNPSPAFARALRGGANLFTGSIVVLDARTGAYKRHFEIVPKDWHDWDVSSPPILIRTAGGKNLMADAPKDGRLYGFDRESDTLLYRTPVTRIENVDTPFAPGKQVRFCPGVAGGDEWSSPAYDPRTNLIVAGEIEWCTTVTLQTNEELRAARPGQTWFGNEAHNPFHLFGRQDRVDSGWAGWVYAVDADSGVWKWRLKSNYPIEGGVTPTAGGVVMFGDLGGNFYVLDAETGRKLWGRKIGGPIAGGVITYWTGGGQKIAVATGLANVTMPTAVTTGKIVVLGLDGAASTVETQR